MEWAPLEVWLEVSQCWYKVYVASKRKVCMEDDIGELCKEVARDTRGTNSVTQGALPAWAVR